MDFFNINGWEFIVLLLLATFIFGPDRLPKAISDGVKMLRNLRDMARNATSDLSRELGTDIQLEDLNPKALLRKHILSEEDEIALRRPLDDLRAEMTGVHRDLRGHLGSVRSDVDGARQDLKKITDDLRRKPGGAIKPASGNGPAAVAPVAGSATPSWDDDAT